MNMGGRGRREGEMRVMRSEIGLDRMVQIVVNFRAFTRDLVYTWPQFLLHSVPS
jgi:hypothetical protein